MVTFPERRFPGGHFPGWDNFLWLIYTRTLNMNNTLGLYKFIPRRKANWLALLTPQGYAMPNAYLPPVLRLMSYETSKVRLKLHVFRLSSPGLVLKLQILCAVLVVAACYLLQCGQPPHPIETKLTKSKQRNDNDDCYLILETTGTWKHWIPTLLIFTLDEFVSVPNWLNPFKYTQYGRSVRLQRQHCK